MGIFLLAALFMALFACLGAANVVSICTEPAYTLYVTFDNIGGLKARSPIGIGGVVVDRVADITLDPKTYLLRVTLEIERCYNRIPDTSSLGICTSGLLEGQYLTLNIGFEDPELGTAILKDSDTIQNTRPAMVLEDLVDQSFYGSKGDDNENSDDTPVAAPGNKETAEPVGATK